MVLDRRARIWPQAGLVLGGSPWGVVRLAPRALGLLSRVAAAGAPGLSASSEDPVDQAVVDRLVDRGVVHPVVRPAGGPAGEAAGPRRVPDVAVVIPVFERPDLLAACLATLDGYAVVVVDDASTDERVGAVAHDHGAVVVRHPVNRGPAAGRNTGIAATNAPVVAFVDADCVAAPGWVEALLPLFDDPRVAAVAPRVRPRTTSGSLLARHESARSALDMGRYPQLVRPGGHLGFVPSAALLVRREALQDKGFDESLRLGEDVDLVWRLAEAGWHVRYEPAVTVWHDMREPAAWARRRYDYGTSAAELDRRHPGKLTPARVSPWNVAAGALLLAGRPRLAAAVAAVAAGTLARQLRRSQVTPRLAAVVVGQGLLSDAVALGHALRREWWPLGWAAIALAARPGGHARGRIARAAAACILGPVALEWVRERPDVDPLRYLLLRLIEDAAYGSGVIVSASRGRRPGALLPTLRRPSHRRPAP